MIQQGRACDTAKPYILNTRSEEHNTVFYSYLLCFMNTVTLNMFLYLTGSTWRNTLHYSYEQALVSLKINKPSTRAEGGQRPL